MNKEGGLLLYTPEDPTFAHNDRIYSSQRSLTARNETARKVLREKLNANMIEIAELEDLMGIVIQWTPQTPEYQDTEKLLEERDWLAALDRLHKLVIQRMFELQKMNLAGTGATSADSFLAIG